MLLFSLLFVWCPLFGILAYALYVSHQEETAIKRFWGLAVMLALYLGCLAVTKNAWEIFWNIAACLLKFQNTISFRTLCCSERSRCIMVTRI